MADLELAIGHHFADTALLQLALTHKSCGSPNNERLEYLGDAVLDLIVGEHLFHVRPSADEQVLTLMRSSLVKKSTLAELARELDLGAHMHLGVGERKSGGFRRDSILADALEAVVGAVYLDGGIGAAKRFVLALIESRAAILDPVLIKDAKTRLQEILQSRQLALPTYDVVKSTGEDHAREFEVICRITALKVHTRGVGRSRRDAEKIAAELAIEAVLADETLDG